MPTTTSPDHATMPVAYFHGGRDVEHQPHLAETDEESPSDVRNNRKNKISRNDDATRPQKFDDDLPEGVDFSEGGWATDFAAALVGFLFLLSGWDRYGQHVDHFLFLHAGTAIAHVFGGLAHRFYPNRASDGTGMIGFYVTMVLGYGGNCMRYALGWDLKSSVWPVIGAINFAYLVVTATWTVCTMERTGDRIDSAEETARGFLPDKVYALGELAAAILEVVTGVVFLIENQDASEDTYAVVAVASNVIGWVAVYAVGGIVFLAGIDYNPAMMQRIFHFAMIVMLWAINEYATRAEEDD